MLDYFLKYGSILIFIFDHYHQQKNIYRNCRVIFLYQSFQPEIFQTYFFQLYCSIKGLISKTWWFVNFWKLDDLWYFQGLVQRILYKGFLLGLFYFLTNEEILYSINYHGLNFIMASYNKVYRSHYKQNHYLSFVT